MAKSTKRKQRVRRSNLKKTVRGSQRLNRAVNNMKTTKKRRVRRVSRKGRKKSRQSGGKTGTYADAVNLFNRIFGTKALDQISKIDGIKVTEGEETVSGKHYMLISNLNNNQAVKFRHHFIGVTGCSTLQFKKALKVYIYASGKGENSVKVPIGFEKKLIFLQKDPSKSVPQDGLLTPGETGNSLANIIYNTLNIERDETGFIPKAPVRKLDQADAPTDISADQIYLEPEPQYVYSEAAAPASACPTGEEAVSQAVSQAEVDAAQAEAKAKAEAARVAEVVYVSVQEVAEDGNPKPNPAPVKPVTGLYSIPIKDKIPEYFITENNYLVPFDKIGKRIQYEEGEAYFIVTNQDKQYVVEADAKPALVPERQSDA